jgi:hypothetical protein
MLPGILAALTLALAANAVAAQTATRADSMEANVYRTVIQRHAPGAAAVVLRTLEDDDVCPHAHGSTDCLTADQRAEFGSALASFRERNPKTGTWSDAALSLVGPPVSDTLSHACDARHFAFSRAGFDPAYRVAIVRYTLTTGRKGGIHCGSQEAGAYLLRRGTDNTWSIAHRIW